MSPYLAALAVGLYCFREPPKVTGRKRKRARTGNLESIPENKIRNENDSQKCQKQFDSESPSTSIRLQNGACIDKEHKIKIDNELKVDTGILELEQKQELTKNRTNEQDETEKESEYEVDVLMEETCKRKDDGEEIQANGKENEEATIENMQNSPDERKVNDCGYDTEDGESVFDEETETESDVECAAIESALVDQQAAHTASRMEQQESRDIEESFTEIKELLKPNMDTDFHTATATISCMQRISESDNVQKQNDNDNTMDIGIIGYSHKRITSEVCTSTTFRENNVKSSEININEAPDDVPECTVTKSCGVSASANNNSNTGVVTESETFLSDIDKTVKSYLERHLDKDTPSQV